jgi:hypothetical protein
MSMTLRENLRRIDLETRIQYGLMFLFGSLSLIAAIAPLELVVKAVFVSALFGLTAGIWISHLIQMIQKAAGERATETA